MNTVLVNSVFLTNWIDSNSSSSMSDQKIKVIGKVKSEKLHERLFTVSESKRIQIFKNIYIINNLSKKKSTNNSIKSFQEKIKLLTEQEIIKLLKKELII